jgi:predicted RNA-binding protein
MIPRDKSKVIQLRVSEETRKSIEHYADNANETISDFIRKAVEMRMNLPTAISKPYPEFNEKMKTVTEKYIEKPENKLDKVLSQPPKHPKPNMVQSFMKGGK